ncbi:MAG: hypothetical protein JNN05_03840, partial [Candidatus Omnitrophica bacterium]|nr:hypothetical protein [Candidatus Omnitrophota bacterium]
MNRFESFIKTVFIGGVAVLLPILILVFIFSIVFKFATGLIEPFTHVLVERFEISVLLADVIVVFLTLFLAFIVGLLVQTNFGK